MCADSVNISVLVFFKSNRNLSVRLCNKTYELHICEKVCKNTFDRGFSIAVPIDFTNDLTTINHKSTTEQITFLLVVASFFNVIFICSKQGFKLFI